ncbi:MAG: metalloendopeptidase, partial [Alistipes sp.]|nr:metalloendopeptidase [Alistipes sp.]
MKRYILTLLAVWFAATAFAQENPADTVAEHDIHEAIDYSSKERMKAEMADEQARIDSLSKLLTPAQAATVDSIVAMRLRLARKRIESVPALDSLAILDTLPSGDDAVDVVLFANGSWRYVRTRAVAKDSTIFEKYWDTEKLFPYKDVEYSSLPKSLVIDLVDSTNGYHTPYKASPIRSRYGPRRGRAHQGVDLAL